MKKWLCVLSLMAVILIVPGCGNAISTNNPKNEKEIAEDILANKNYIEQYSRFTISELSIGKRQTDTDNKIDKIYITLSVSNGNETLEGYVANTIEGNVDLIATYGLYNDGWILDDLEIDETGEYGEGVFTALEGRNLTEEQLRSDLTVYGYNSGYESSDSITIYDHQFDSESQTDKYFIQGINRHQYYTQVWDIAVNYTFQSMDDNMSAIKAGEWGIWSRQGAIDVDENSFETFWHLSGTYDNGDRGIEIFNDKPEEIMQIGIYGDTREFRLFNTWEYDLRYLAGVIGAENEVGYGGYSARLWDGNETNYNRLDYTHDFTYFAVQQGSRWPDVLLIGPDHLAFIKFGDYGADPVSRTVYVKITELKGEPNNSNSGEVGYEDTETIYIPGTYTGIGTGFNSRENITVSVTVDNNRIASITVDGHSETAGVGTKAFDPLTDAIIAANGTDVDAVSGATITSRGFIEAVNNALGQALTNSGY